MTFSLSPDRQRMVSALTAVLLTLGLVPLAAAAQQAHYSDVRAGAYYENAANSLLSVGALDARETRLRPSDLATRAELTKLLVRVHSEPLVYPMHGSFNDVRPGAWYFPYVEAAARAGWVHGDDNCYQNGTHPCTARPSDSVNRAEAAALLVRAFALPRTGAAPDFPDNLDRGQWYYQIIQAAADHCVLQGDSRTERVRPAALMNRAEMVVMFDRARQNLVYGKDCGVPVPTPVIDDARAVNSTLVRLSFNTDLDSLRAGDATRYTITRVGGEGPMDIRNARMAGSRTVDLELRSALMSGISYVVTANNLRTADGVVFTDSQSFSLPAVQPDISSLSAPNDRLVRLRFTGDLDATRSEDEFRYAIADMSGQENVSIRTAILVDPRTVELTLNDSLRAQHSYAVTVTGMRTSDGVIFSTSGSVVFPGASVSFHTAMSGLRESPPNMSLAEGTGSFVLTDNGLSYDITVRNLSTPITAAHFHRGVVGVSGPMIQAIIFNGNRAVGTWTGLTPEQRADLFAQGIYVNVHTTQFPDGEIRGQVIAN